MGRTLCDMCGDRLAAPPGVGPAPAPNPGIKRRTEIESVGPAPSTPPNPSTKRRTEYDPGARPEPRPAAPPAAPAWTPPADDPFAPRPRAPINQEDPWADLARGRVSPPEPRSTAVPPAPPSRAPWGAPPDVAPVAPHVPAPVAPPAPVRPPPVPGHVEPVRAPPPEPPWGGEPRPGPSPGKARTVIEYAGASPAAPLQVRGALFEYRSPGDAGRIHPLRAGQNRLGRSPDRDIVIEGDPRVSGEHGFVVLNGESATFIDNSTNGSVVDGRRVHAGVAELRQGSVIGLGDVRLVFLVVPSAAFSGG